MKGGASSSSARLGKGVHVWRVAGLPFTKPSSPLAARFLLETLLVACSLLVVETESALDVVARACGDAWLHMSSGSPHNLRGFGFSASIGIGRGHPFLSPLNEESMASCMDGSCESKSVYSAIHLRSGCGVVITSVPRMEASGKPCSTSGCPSLHGASATLRLLPRLPLLPLSAPSAALSRLPCPRPLSGGLFSCRLATAVRPRP
mmetsp:Transcript_20113/g.46435  ORF Transcript_20113/g.46435 Transcript_20113/m.46435 type:complete len:205 (+) Transcript_20113:115-729(+)